MTRKEETMRNQGQLFLGGLLIFLGLLFLFGTLFRINVWAFCWPIGLILLGAWILLRPRMIAPGTPVHVTPLGEINRDGSWRVANEEFWLFVGDAKFDLTHADIPIGETTLRLFGFVGDVELIVPQGVGVAVSSTAFVIDLKIFGQPKENFVMPYSYTSDDYATADRKVRLEVTHFVASVKVKRE
jgi:lia operon protein LiaF